MTKLVLIRGLLAAGARRAHVTAPALAIFVAATPSHADERRLAYGKHLAQECASCHRIDGTATGIPSIVGMEPGIFKAALEAFAKGERDNPVMVSVARSLDGEQMDALAAYYASLKKR